MKNLCDELYALFVRNFPFAVRSEGIARRILSSKENKIFAYDDGGSLFAAAVVLDNAIIMLCVDKEYRNKGYGKSLLKQCEEYILSKGYEEVVIGAGREYLCPGIPVSEPPFEEGLELEGISPLIPKSNAEFFKKRGYEHFWDSANCFDMKLCLSDDIFTLSDRFKKAEGYEYRWAGPDDVQAILSCTDDAWSEFSKYYKNERLYDGSSSQRVLIALEKDTVLGTLIVSFGTEDKDTGSVGCTTTRNSHRGRGIASRLVYLGTLELYKAGFNKAFLGYTYSGLDKMYGKSGYTVSCLYFMGKKRLL